MISHVEFTHQPMGHSHYSVEELFHVKDTLGRSSSVSVGGVWLLVQKRDLRR